MEIPRGSLLILVRIIRQQRRFSEGIIRHELLGHCVLPLQQDGLSNPPSPLLALRVQVIGGGREVVLTQRSSFDSVISRCASQTVKKEAGHLVFVVSVAVGSDDTLKSFGLTGYPCRCVAS